ncbi:MAG: RNA-binding protein [Robiginitomaculum sp.]|nr:RNA-binding protein [Robiginitomaculum sp.]
MRERKCIVSNEVLPETGLVRFVVDPDGTVFSDVRAKAPGRGVWVTANRQSIEEAINRNGFTRGFKKQVTVTPDLPDMVEAQLRKICLDILGLGRRGGQLITGFEKVRSEIRANKPGWLIEAADSKEDGRHKVLALCRAIWDEVPLIGCFTSTELGIALGRDHGAHALMRSGAVSQNLGLQLQRLSGFTPLIPLHWRKIGG